MTHADQTTAPPTRAERQRRTRDALIEAARAAFTRDGYHGANLVTIATEAGFTKGAVYSNFASKGELFLAVMDANLDTIRTTTWDPFEQLADHEERSSERYAALRGFALATLEFIATAARDETLADELTQRVQVLLDAYGRVAGRSKRPEDPLPDDHLAVLLAALDQGFAMLELVGIGWIDAPLLRYGLRRLLDPEGAGALPTPTSGAPARRRGR